MKKVSKVLTATISCLMATTLVMPISAEGEVEKKESVYTVLNSDGSVSTITVSDTLHSDSGFSNYQDKSDLQNVENLKSSDAVNSSNGNLIWNTSDKDIYYQGTSNKELPLTVKITYVLDGKELTSDELVGKSGHLAIKINVTNSSKQTYTANNKTYNLVTPFVTGVVCMMDDDIFTNVKVNSGTVTSDSSHSLITSVMVPGLKSGLKQVLDTDLMHKLEDYLIDEITIEADVTDYESPTLMMAAATSTDALKEEFEDIDDFSSIFDKLDDLKEATNELIDGTSDLYDGAVKLNDGVGTLLDGTKQLVSGSQKVADGAKSAATGSASLETGLAEAVASNETLVNGVNSVTDAVLDSVQSQLRTQLKDDSITLTWTTYSDVLADYAQISDSMSADVKKQIRTAIEAKTGTLDDATFEGVLYMCAANGCNSSETITNYLTNNASNLSIASGVKQAQNDASLIGQGNFSKIDRVMNLGVYEGSLKAVKEQLKESFPALSDAQAEAVWLLKASNPSASSERIANAIQSAPENAKGIDDESVKNLISSLRTNEAYTSTYGNAAVYAGLCQTLAANGVTDASQQAVLLTIVGEMHSDATSLASALQAASSDATIAKNVNNAINTASNKNASGYNEAQALIKGMINSVAMVTLSPSLKSVSDTLQSVASLRTGIVKYTDGISEAYAGSKELASGLSTLSSGTNDLNAGIQKVNSGTSDLKDGSQQLADGAKTLKDGMVKYNDEAISKLTDSSRITSLQEASNLLTAMSESEDNYSNYSGISDDAEGSIKFIFKVNGSKKAKSDDASSETTKEKVSFWQRIKNLFKF